MRVKNYEMVLLIFGGNINVKFADACLPLDKKANVCYNTKLLVIK